MSSPYLVGCCGWREAKPKYFARFPVVELQDTFYELPSVALATKWRTLAPPEFHFAMKAWQLITHTPASPTYRRLKSRVTPEESGSFGSFRSTEGVFLAWERTAAIAEILRAKVVLFQCPASFTPDRENVANLRRFFLNIDRGESLLAWEPRGEWPDELVRSLCSELQLLHCVDPFKRRSVFGQPTYWRLHGRGGYRYKYSDEELHALKGMTQQVVREGNAPLYILFNNVWMGEDAVRFQTMLG